MRNHILNSLFGADEILLVPTWIITISILIIFIFPLESNYVILPIVAPGNDCVVHPLILSTYFGINAEVIVALFSW
jgi:hypothetical protein